MSQGILFYIFSSWKIRIRWEFSSKNKTSNAGLLFGQRYRVGTDEKLAFCLVISYVILTIYFILLSITQICLVFVWHQMRWFKIVITMTNILEGNIFIWGLTWRICEPVLVGRKTRTFTQMCFNVETALNGCPCLFSPVGSQIPRFRLETKSAHSHSYSSFLIILIFLFR